jgi:prepilin-type processing-associated H-X9-DG protein
MTRHSAFTLVELVFAIVVAVIAITVILASARDREVARKMKCKGNLRQLGTGMIQYVDQYGKGRYYSWPGPREASFNGSQWIASMYWISMINEPDLFICPSTRDDNEAGGRLGRRFAPLRPMDVSYAGRNGVLGAIEDRVPSNTLMMSDDTEGTANHDDGVNLLYFDAHLEWNAAISPLATGRKGKPVIGKDKPVDMLRN